ncbi:hypothetical protein GGI07_004310 [Coemansia sp. Benny D115]|nr:hypothetical protein GGI07_004310 [Coemansia sp. Benny D115]
MSRPVLSLSLPPALKSKLINNGFYTVRDFDEVTSTDDLLQFLSDAEMHQVAHLARVQPMARPALALFEEARRKDSFLTHIPELDRLLGGKGMQLSGGSVCEVTAKPGGGALELCLHLCMAVQIPLEHGGAGKGAVYLDTTGGFVHSGAARAARAMERWLNKSNAPPITAGDNVAAFLGRISVLRIFAAHELVAVLDAFDDIYNSLNNDVGVLVVNTVSWPLLVSVPDNIFNRQALQGEVARLLVQIAAKHHIAVVLVSQAKSVSSDAKIVPLDGDVWGRISANRIAIDRASADSKYVVELLGSSSHPTGRALVEFCIAD